MKTIRRPLRLKPLARGLLFSLLSSVCGLVCHAANHAVAPGQNVQTVVDGAASGDIIRFLPGTYGDLTIVNKDLTLKAIGESPAVLGAVEVNGSAVTMIKVGAAAFEANDLEGDSSKIIAIQGTFENFETKAAETHLAYCNLKHLVFRGVGTVTGCEFNGGNLEGGIGVDVYGQGTRIVLRNSHIHDYKLYVYDASNKCIGVRVRDGAIAEILNNVIRQCQETRHNGTETDCGMGVFVKPGAHAVIFGNVIKECGVSGGAGTGDRLVWAPATSVVRNNVLQDSGDLVGGGVTAVGTINADPKFVGGSPYSYQLQGSSPAKNAGPPDAFYNDRDGTRNDMGMYGGHNYIPNGRTTDKPIPIQLSTTPAFVPTGGTVTIESTGATVK